MKLQLLCASVLLAAGVATAEDPANTAKANKATALDGTWTVLSAEKNGEAVKDAKDMTVTVKDNVITCNCAKSGTTTRIELTGPGKGKVTTTEGKEKDGDRTIAKDGAKGEAKEAVIVLTTDYLAVCVLDEKPTLGGDGKPRERNPDAAYQPSTKEQSTVILKRGENTK